MTHELFPPESVFQLSPKLLWLREHNLETVQLRQPDEMSESPETGADIPIWVCRVKKQECGGYHKNEIAGGDTEEEAICSFCEVSGITHWSGTP